METETCKTALTALARRAREASMCLSRLSGAEKDRALTALAGALTAHRDELLSANAGDVAAARAAGMSEAMLDRLTLTDARIAGMAQGIKKIAALPDPIGKGDVWHHPNGMEISRRRVPLGVIAIIYEARPNVTSDAAALTLKSANAVILRGGKEAVGTNTALVRLFRETLEKEGLPADAVNYIESTDRAYTAALLTLSGEIDAAIPRGGRGFIEFVKETARVPVIETGAGNCHLYVHEDAEADMAQSILLNAKTSRPSVCNAVEHLLLHEKIAPAFLPRALKALEEAGVTVRGCEKCRALIPTLQPVTADDFATEYNDLTLSVKIVASLAEATAHINTFGTRHSETIVTRSLAASAEFSEAVDAACVYTNASSRFTDGEEFGFGAEIGISTQKLHARGPMGLDALTTEKYLIRGEGQIRT